jgi:hypothetical protein
MDDMRLFSDGGRGSGAIKGYCDVIISQEWSKGGDEEIVHWGAFGKNIPDLAPRALVQTAENSGCWVPMEADGLSQTVRESLKALKEHEPGLVFEDRPLVVDLLERARGFKRSAAQEHVTKLVAKGLIQINKTKYVEKLKPSPTLMGFIPAPEVA